MTTAAVTSQTSESSRMGPKIGAGVLPFKKQTLASVCYRLHQLHGESPTTWENRMSGEVSDYKQVARMNRELIAAGLSDKVAELMATIDASLMGEAVPHLYDAIAQEQHADREEDACGDAFVLAIAQGAVPVAEAKSWIKRSAAARFRAEQCEAAVQRWIESQEAK
jgi:hypothetical protein